MPWVDQEECIGCGICVDICPTGAISVKGGKTGIDMAKCISAANATTHARMTR